MQTEYGELRIERTLYQNKETGTYHHLLDEVLEIQKHERLEDNLKVKLLGAASDMSYAKAGTINGSVVSRQTVMNLVHKLKDIKAEPEDERKVESVFIEADEDHIAMQDGANRIMKLVYVHEGVERVSTNRNKVVHPWYFTTIDRKSEDLWFEVEDYVSRVYGDEAKITVRGDGGSWITSGAEYFPGSKFELDSFHLFKSITRATGHCRRLRSPIINSIKEKDYDLTHKLYQHLYSEATKESDKKETLDSMNYVLNHYDEIAAFTDSDGCSAEGHVSHMLSSRLSSRPMGWSERGVNNVAALRAYIKNGGDLHELVRQRKEEVKESQFIRRVKEKSKTKFIGATYSIPILQASSKHKTKFLIKNLIS
jgi:hypothetical protein